MITITKQPAGNLLSGNDIVYEVKATDNDGNLFRYIGARVELRAPQNSTLQQGESVIFNWSEPSGANGNVAFIVADGAAPPGTSVTYLPLPAGYPTALSHWEAIAAIIGAQSQIRPIFDCYVEVDPNAGTISLWLVTKAYEEGWSFTVGPDGDFTYTPYTYTDLTNNRLPGHRIIVDIFLENTWQGGDYVRLTNLATIAGANSRQVVNVSGMLDAGIRNRLPDLLIPAWDTSLPLEIAVWRNYYARISEYSSEPLFSADSYYTDPLRVFCGGVSNRLDLTGYLDSITIDNSILSWRSRSQTIGYRQPYFLNFYVSDNYIDDFSTDLMSCFAQVEEYDDTGALTANRLIWRDANAVVVEFPGFGCLPVGVDALGIAPSTHYYRVRAIADVFGDTTPLTDWLTLTVDRNYYIEERYLAYLNSFCMPEVLRCTGDLSKEVTIATETSQAIRQADAGAIFSEESHHRVSWRDIFTYNSAFLDERDADAVQHELRLAENIYEISPAGFIPLLTTGKSFPISSTRQNLHQLTIEALPAALDRFYSRVDGTILEPPIEVWGSADGIGYWASPLANPWT